MLNSPISDLELDVKIMKVFSTLRLKSQKEKNLQKFCLVSDLASNENLPVGLNFLSTKFKKMICYLLILHYFPLDRSLFCYMVLDLQDLFETTESFWLSVLTDKQLFLKYLEKQETMTEQQFFSGICNERTIRETISLISLRFEEKFSKPKRIIRRKGYRDKGTLGSVSSQAFKRGVNEDFYCSIVQFQKEQEEVLRSKLCILLEEYLLEGRVLTGELLVQFRLRKDENHERANHRSEEENYLKQRSNEDTIRKEREHLKELERLRIQTIETGVSAVDLGI